MATEQKSGDEGDLLEDTDPANEDESEDETEEGKGEKKTPEQQLADLATEVKRITTELNQTKRAITTVTRQRDEAREKLTKVAGDSGERPEDIANKLAEKDRRLAQVEAKARIRQIGSAVAAYLSEHHPLHVDAVEWLPAKVATLMSDEDIADDGEYLEDVLMEKIEPLAQKYVEKNPRQQRQERNKDGGAGGEGNRGQKVTKEVSELESLPIEYKNALAKMGRKIG